MAASRTSLLILLPPLVFLGFAVVAFTALKRENRDELPSARAGGPAPSLAALDASRRRSAPDRRGAARG